MVDSSVKGLDFETPDERVVVVRNTDPDLMGSLVLALARRSVDMAMPALQEQIPTTSLVERLQQKLSNTGITVGPVVTPKVVTVENTIIDPPAEKPKQTMSGLMHELQLRTHDIVPVPMFNFLSQVMPEQLNDDVHNLKPTQASLLTHMLLRCFVATRYPGSRMRGRKLSATCISRQVGLHNEQLTPARLAEKLALETAADIYRRNDLVKRVLTERVASGRLTQMFEAVSTNNVASVARSIEVFEVDIQKQQI